MKKLSVLAVALLFACNAFSQQTVKWSFLAKKVKEKTYEIHLIATIPSGWYIYAQKQPEESSSQPVEITVNKSPLLAVSDDPFTEKGQLTRKRYPSLGYVANTYKDTVEFVKTITVKGNVNTELLGTVRFQACTDQMCLPPEDAVFKLSLQ